MLTIVHSCVKINFAAGYKESFVVDKNIKILLSDRLLKWQRS